jgi:parallel beta-helix repeat protein
MRTQRQPAGSTRSAFRRLPVALAVAGALSQGAMAATITVSNGNSSGAGSLYQAILDANSNCGTDASPTIVFSGPFTIAQSAALPQFFCPAPAPYNPTIDAMTGTGAVANSSSTGFNASLKVAVDFFSNFSTYGCGIEYTDFGGYGGHLTVKGLELRNFNYGGSADRSIWGSQTGICGKVDMKGSVVQGMPNAMFAESGSVIGGDLAADRNWISNFEQDGIGFDGDTTIKNNLIGVTQDGSAASTGFYAIDWCGCNSVSGTIANNVVVANDTGIYAGGFGAGLTISGNKVGTNSTGDATLGNGFYGIYVDSPGATTISNNVVSGWTYGVDIWNGQGVTVSGNMIGTNAAGSAALPNGTGIEDAWSYGTRVDGGNVISGNNEIGVSLYNSTGAVITGNLIGIDATGTTAIGNFQGIYIGFASGNNEISGNAIGGNFYGIYSSDASYTTFADNKVGKSFGGTTVANVFGVLAECGTNLSFNGNFIGASSYGGLIMAGIQNSVFNGNTIGGSLPNGDGVTMDYTTCGSGPAQLAAKALSFGSSNASDDNQFIGNTISNNLGKGVWINGGSGNSFFQNTINGNGADGVFIRGIYTFDSYGNAIDPFFPAVANALTENLIFGNANKNVNLDFEGGPLPNDAGDADSNKPNNWQNYPILDSAVRDASKNQTIISFRLDSKAGTYRVDFFANDNPGKPSGQTYLGNTFITLPADGETPGSWAWGGTAADNFSAIAIRQVPLDTFPPSFGNTDSSELSPQVSATALPVPGVSVNPALVNFGDVVVGRSSSPTTVTVTSTGTAPYVVSSLRENSCTGPAICSTGSFTCSTTCSDGSTWSAPSSCTITAAFTPAALGSQSKTLALCDNAAGSPRTILLTGNGVPVPEVDISFSPASWAFGEVLVGVQSPSKAFTLTNAGSNTVYLGSPITTDDFVVTNNGCGAQVAGGASCNVDVAYAPASRGGKSGSVQITGSNTPPPTPAALRAKVVTPATNVASSVLFGSGLQFGEVQLPASLSFGSMVLHSQSRQQTVTLNNTGNGPLAISSVTISGPFTMTNNCGTSLDVGASCSVVANFNPTALGSFNGTLTIVSDAPGGARSIALSASVVADAKPVVRVSSTTIGFGNRVIGSQSPPTRITITNEGSQQAVLGALTFTQPEGSGRVEFSVSGSTCGSILDPQATCVADLVFKPLGFGPREGQLQVPSNSADSPQRVTVGGTGCRPFVSGGNRAGGRDPCAP